MTADFTSLRAEMEAKQLRGRKIVDERVLAAMATVAREHFVPERWRAQAYADRALPIGEEQSISQPWIVAAICQALALTGAERVLEVGTGSGYSTAVIARLASGVLSVERHAGLARRAARDLAALEVHNVELLVGDGSRGVPDRAPFDAIAVHAAAPVPPPALLGQLAEGGRLVVPVVVEDGPEREELVLLTRRGESFERTAISPCRFVPLIGAEGF